MPSGTAVQVVNCPVMPYVRRLHSHLSVILHIYSVHCIAEDIVFFILMKSVYL